MRFFYIVFFCQIILSTLRSQNYEFLGLIKLNGDKNQALSYRVVFSENNGIIKGFSITDLTGEHETKNVISGTYDASKKLFSFREEKIIYTKSPISTETFCFINYSGKIKLGTDKPRISGNFSGKFKNNSTCINGTLELIGSETIQKLLNKFNSKIQKSKKLDQAEKEKYNPVKLMDSLKLQQVVANENINIFIENKNEIHVQIWDNGNEDGDLINLYLNEKLILENYYVTKDKKSILLETNRKINKMQILAVNQGSQGLNTVMVDVEGDSGIKFQSNLKSKESSWVTFYKD